MTKKTMTINVDKECWGKIRNNFPGISDSMRSKILVSNFDMGGFKEKLQPERTDTRSDLKIKNTLKGIIGGF